MSTKEMIYNAVSDLTEEDAQKLYSIIQIIFRSRNEDTLTESQKAFQELEKLIKPFKTPVDEKEEYYRYLEEKYENLD
ncbi:MAG: hypothetical protein Q4D76_17580 [Oscillospiraceae bacterium]|nr:hypothetical protein [Oscillospiraceae bacterium]